LEHTAAVIVIRSLLRVAGGLLGLGAAVGAVLMPIFAYVNVAAEAGWQKEHPPSLWGGVGYIATVLITVALLSVVAYVFLQYAVKGDANSAKP
jgi:hypothetical protein